MEAHFLANTVIRNASEPPRDGDLEPSIKMETLPLQTQRNLPTS